MPIKNEVHRTFQISGNALGLYPTDLFFGILSSEGHPEMGIPKLHPISGEWGEPLSMTILNIDDSPIPTSLDMVYLSIVERRFYSVERRLPEDKMGFYLAMENDDGFLYDYLVVGMAPFGGVAIWLCGDKKEVLIDWIRGNEVQVDMADFLPISPNVMLDENCDFYINNDPAVKKNLEINGLPPHDLFDKYMQQFNYRYQVMFGKWNDGKERWAEYGEDDVMPELDSLEEALFDGTHDKLNDGGLMKYHTAGKPKKLAVKWHIGKKQYAAYFWFHDEEIKGVFDRFYGPHPETKSDFMIRIDPDKNKYELAMYRYGLKEPYVLPEDSYELIVFRNKFECFRSGNYNRPTGAWIW